MIDVDVAIVVNRDAGISEALLASIADAGFEIVRIVAPIGAIYAAGPEHALDLLRVIEGVESVRRAGSVQLPPMDEAIPQ